MSSSPLSGSTSTMSSTFPSTSTASSFISTGVTSTPLLSSMPPPTTSSATHTIPDSTEFARLYEPEMKKLKGISTDGCYLFQDGTDEIFYRLFFGVKPGEKYAKGGLYGKGHGIAAYRTHYTNIAAEFPDPKNVKGSSITEMCFVYISDTKGENPEDPVFELICCVNGKIYLKYHNFQHPWSENCINLITSFVRTVIETKNKGSKTYSVSDDSSTLKIRTSGARLREMFDSDKPKKKKVTIRIRGGGFYDSDDSDDDDYGYNYHARALAYAALSQSAIRTPVVRAVVPGMVCYGGNRMMFFN